MAEPTREIVRPDKFCLEIEAAYKVLAPPPNIQMSQWADDYRMLSSKTSAEAGRWKTGRAPYQGPMMNAVSDPMNERVVLMTSSQVGKSEILLNTFGYICHLKPAPILLVQPTTGLANSFSKERLAPMITDMPALRGKVSDPKSRDQSNTISLKEFPGGYIALVGANAPTGLASRPIKILLLDEIDRYPQSAGSEGSPIELAIRRTQTFHDRKIVMVSTPVGTDGIYHEFINSTQNYWHVPCPDCGHESVMNWENVRYEKDEKKKAIPRSARYLCTECGTLWNDAQRWQASTRGRFIADNPSAEVPGFAVNALCSPWVKLEELVTAWVKAQDAPEKLKVFINTQLGEPWVQKADVPDWERIWQRRSRKRQYGELTKDVLFLTIGVDVQADRLEGSIWGWGLDKRSWLIEHVIIHGETDTPTSSAWQELAKLLNKTYAHPSGGALGVYRAAIDSGYNTQTVYSWSRTYHRSKLIVIKGMDSAAGWIVGIAKHVDVKQNGKTIKYGASMTPVNSSALKVETYGYLNLVSEDEVNTPYGWIDLPENIDQDFVEQLTSEEHRKVKNSRGYWKYEWVKVKERNEALDCRNYARAAANLAGLDRFTDEQLLKIGERERVAGMSSGKPAVKKKKPASKNTGMDLDDMDLGDMDL